MAETPQWLVDTVPASFRGIEFKSRAIKESGGRNGPDNEYPDAEHVFADDTGRKMRRWTFDAIIIGDNYRARVDALIDAANSKGVGTLVHPYKGAMRVQLRTYELSETTDLGGLAEFSITCVEKGQETATTIQTRDQPGSRVNASASATAEAVAAETVRVLPDSTDPGFVQETASNAINSLGQSVGLTVNLPGVGLPSDLPAVQAVLDAVGLIISASDTVTLEALRLFYDLTLATNSIEYAIAWAQGLFDAGAGGPGEETTEASDDPATQDAIDIDEAYTRLRVRIGISAAATLATQPDAEYETADDANLTRDRILEMFDAEEFTGFDSSDSYSLFTSTRASFVREMQLHALRLPQIAEIEIERVTTALEIVWNQYADADRVQEFADRNGLINPLFVPPGTYEILQ